jgi:competence protein ComFC
MNIIAVFVDLLFPPNVTELLVRSSTTLPLSQGVSNTCDYLLNYNDSSVRAAIVENKFHRNKKAARLLAAPLTAWLEAQNKNMVIIPMPLGPKRQRKRGDNQIENILREVILPTNISINRNILRKLSDTVPQTSLKKIDRIKNITTSCFFVDEETMKTYVNTTFLLVDDVCTTGATMHSARMALTPHIPTGCVLISLALAH